MRNKKALVPGALRRGELSVNVDKGITSFAVRKGIKKVPLNFEVPLEGNEIN